jgi:hypothetical protein
VRRLFLLLVSGLVLASAARAAAAADDEKEGTIEGTAIKRTVGDGWLGLQLKDGTFRLTFYNAKKKPVEADKSSAVFRWPVHYQPNDERTELTGTDNPAVLASSYPVRGPYAFKLHIALLPAAQDGTVEGYVIDFSG